MNAATRWGAATLVFLLTACIDVHAETIGSVDTTFRMVGANDSIEIEAFDDPKIDGVTCHLSRAVTGGVGKLIGTSVDSSDASIACRQIGPIRITEPLEDGEGTDQIPVIYLYTHERLRPEAHSARGQVVQ